MFGIFCPFILVLLRRALPSHLPRRGCVCLKTLPSTGADAVRGRARATIAFPSFDFSLLLFSNPSFSRGCSLQDHRQNGQMLFLQPAAILTYWVNLPHLREGCKIPNLPPPRAFVNLLFLLVNFGAAPRKINVFSSKGWTLLSFQLNLSGTAWYGVFFLSLFPITK